MKMEELKLDPDVAVVKYSEFRQNLKSYCEKAQLGNDIALIRTAKGTDKILDALMIISKEKYDELKQGESAAKQMEEDIWQIHKEFAEINAELRLHKAETLQILTMLNELKDRKLQS